METSSPNLEARKAALLAAAQTSGVAAPEEVIKNATIFLAWLGRADRSKGRKKAGDTAE